MRNGNMSSLVISLDFEMFWGVTDSCHISEYGRNVMGVWEAIPKILKLFTEFQVKGTWATVGMLMCKDYSEWMDRRPAILPTYTRSICSNYKWQEAALENPNLFFGRPLVELIMDTPSQELATHTYSHFFCGEDGVTPEQFSSDLLCAQEQIGELGGNFVSLVFPRNQIKEDFIRVLPACGIKMYRGNPKSWIYRHGHYVVGGNAGRAVRFLDSWIPLSRNLVAKPKMAEKGLVDIPASFFLRPWPRRLAGLESLRLHRMKSIMTAAAQSKGVCHIWWHPHNFGVDIDRNIQVLQSLLEHYRDLRDRYGMKSAAMAEFSVT